MLCCNQDIQTLFHKSIIFRKVLASEISLAKFVKTDAYFFLKEIANKWVDLEALTSITETGVICAWICKLRYNETMSDDDFFTHIKRANLIFAGQVSCLNVHELNPRLNDLISLMWGVLALASFQGCALGAVRVRLSSSTASLIYSSFQKIAKTRYSTHAQFTRIGILGLGKDIITSSHRRYTPLGMGTLLIHRTFQTDEDTKQFIHYKIAPQNFDILFKIEVAGLNDTIVQTLLHWMAINPFLSKFRYKNQCYKKSYLAKQAEKIIGIFKTKPRREHLNYLPRTLNQSLLTIFNTIQSIKPDLTPHLRTTYLKFILKYRIKFGFPWDIKSWQLHHVKVPLGSFIREIVAYEKEFTPLISKEVSQDFSILKEIILSEHPNDLSFRREGFEVLVDISHGKMPPKSIGGLIDEPVKTKKWLVYG